MAMTIPSTPETRATVTSSAAIPTTWGGSEMKLLQARHHQPPQAKYYKARQHRGQGNQRDKQPFFRPQYHIYHCYANISPGSRLLPLTNWSASIRFLPSGWHWVISRLPSRATRMPSGLVSSTVPGAPN